MSKKYLLDIYNRQHYFADRHDAMAERMLKILSIIVGFVSALVVLQIDKAGSFIWLAAVLLGIHWCFFIATLYTLMSIIGPLSSKAHNHQDESILPTGDKGWITNSVLYYRGITSLINLALQQEKIPKECFMEKVKKDFTQDLVQQIFILAKYSEYKRKRLEFATKFTFATCISGSVLVLAFLIIIALHGESTPAPHPNSPITSPPPSSMSLVLQNSSPSTLSWHTDGQKVELILHKNGVALVPPGDPPPID